MTEDVERLVLRMEANTRQFENQLRKARGESAKQLSAIERRTGKMQRRVQTLMAGTFTGALLARFGRSTLKLAGDFEASMNRVQAALGATGQEMKSLNAKARELGKTTVFAASEAADAIEVLAKNGLNADQILGGAVDASLALAGALGGDLASSADLATDLMAQFKPQASDLPGIVDQVTGAALKSKFGFDDLRLAIGQAGGVAGGAGVEIEDFITAIAAIAPNFASGSDAGTSFKTFLQRLTPESDKARAAMERLGLEFFDAAGKTKPLEAIAGELQDALKGLSEEARNEVLKIIFGTDAIRTAVALMEQGTEGVLKLKSAIGDVSAERQAEARMQGLNGALRELNSAWEDLLLTAANGGALDASTAAVGRLTDAIRFLSENFEEIVPWIERLATVLTGVLVARGLEFATARTIATGRALLSLADNMHKVRTGTVTLGAALKGLGGGPLGVLLSIAGIAFLEFRRGARDASAALNDLESRITSANASTMRLEGVNRDLEKSKDDLAAASERYRRMVELEGPAAQSAAQMEIDAINARIAGREAEAKTIAATLKLKEQEIAVAEQAARDIFLDPFREAIAPRGVRKGARSGATVPFMEQVSDTDAMAVAVKAVENAQARIQAGNPLAGDARLNAEYGNLLRLVRERRELAEASENARRGGFRRAESLVASPAPSAPPASNAPSGTVPPVVSAPGGGETPPELTPLQRITQAETRRLQDETLRNRLIGKDAPERAEIETFERILRDMRVTGVTLADLQKDGFASAEDYARDFAKAARARVEDRIQLQERERLGAETRKALARANDTSAGEASAAKSDPAADAGARFDRDIALEQAKIARLRDIRDRNIGTVPADALPVRSAIEQDQRRAARQTALDNAAANAPEGLEAEARQRESLRLEANDLERGIRDIAAAQEDLARTEREAAEARKRDSDRAREESDQRRAALDKERIAGRAALDQYIAGAAGKAAVTERLQAALDKSFEAYEAELLAIKAETEAERQLVAAKEAGVAITDDLRDASLASAQLRVAAEQELREAVEARRAAEKKTQDEAKAATDALAASQKDIDDAAKAAGSAIGKTFDDIITGSASARDAVKSLILELGRMALQESVIGPITDGASGLLGNVLSGVVGSVTGGINPFGAVAANGMAFGGGGRPVTAFARGGIVSGATPFGFKGGRQLGLMGEAGPEAIMPLKRGADGKLGVAGGGGGGRSTSITVNISTPNAESFRRSQSQVSATLARAVARGQRNL